MDKTETDIRSSDKILSQSSDFSSKSKTIFLSGCGFLIASLLCLAVLPITFFFVLGLGMSGDFGDLVVGSAMMGLFLNIVFVMVFGIIGVIVLSIWAIMKYQTRLAQPHNP